MPSNITTDTGYGSEENYGWLEKKRITAYVKYNHFDRDQHGKAGIKNHMGPINLPMTREKTNIFVRLGKR
jgi:hypothetical protein